MKHALALPLVAALFAVGCAQQPQKLRVEPTYQEALNAPLLQSSRDAVAQLVANLDVAATGPGPVLVATVVNVNDMSHSAPLGRTLSEQYANAMAATGFDVKEIKLRSDLVIEPQSGETILSRRLALLKDMQPAQALLVGTLSMSQRTMYISARLVNPTTADVLSAGTYRLYMDKNVLAMFGLRTVTDDNDITPPREPLVNRIFY